MRVLSEAECDGVYIARGVLGRPWIFDMFYKLMNGEAVDESIDLNKLREVMLEHYALALEYFDEKRTISRMYKHIAWYLKGYKNLDSVMKEYRKAIGFEKFKSFVKRLRLDDKKKLFLKERS